ncbi:MAG: PEP-CTERM sorting domain-containing protein [Opitutales bacterium]|nr:PEP-CTERM sorting domain-containing protein [Opitutales bacterium]
MTSNPIKTLLLLVVSILLSINMVSAGVIPAVLLYDTESNMIWFEKGYYETLTVSLSASGTSTFDGGTIDGASFDMTSATYGSLLLNSTSDSNPAETNTLTVYASGLSFEYSNGLVSSVSTTVSVTGMGSAWSYSSLGASDQATLESVLSNLDYIISTDSIRIYLYAETYSVPEPSTYATLAGLGVLAFAGYRRRAIRNISSM